MPSDLVVVFSQMMVARLHREGMLVLGPGGSLSAVADQVANALGQQRPGQQVIHTVGRTLESSDLVEELFASDEDLIRFAAELAT